MSRLGSQPIPDDESDMRDATPDRPLSRPVRLSLSRDDEISACVHEIQNALGCALGWCDLANQTNDPNIQSRALPAIELGLRRARDLLARLSKPSERLGVKSVVFRIAPLLAEVHELLHPRALETNVSLTITPVDEALSVRGDPDRVVQIITNLVLNAIDGVLAVGSRSPKQGHIQIDTILNETVASINVIDDGIGMSQTTIDRIFEPHFTTHPEATAKRKAGSGLGLAVSRALAEAMHGDLQVTSEEGKGTTVTLSLELATLPIQQPSRHEPVVLQPNLQILVVDDEPTIRDLLDVALNVRGAKVMLAASLHTARELLAAHTFDVLLVDDTLGVNESGAALITEQLRLEKRPVCVLMTGAPSVDHLPPNTKRWLLRKPFTLDEVVRTVATATRVEQAVTKTNNT